MIDIIILNQTDVPEIYLCKVCLMQMNLVYRLELSSYNMRSVSIFVSQ